MEKNDERKLYKVFWALDLLAFALLITLDLFTKRLAVTYLKNNRSITLVSGVLELQYLENRGAAFGIMQNRQVFFLIVGVIFLAVAGYFLYYIPASAKYRSLRAVIVLIASGAAGNLIDRAFQGYVVDFIYFSYINFPVFNVADCYVTVGTILLVILVIFFYRDEDFDFKKARSRRIHSSMTEDES